MQKLPITAIAGLVMFGLNSCSGAADKTLGASRVSKSTAIASVAVMLATDVLLVGDTASARIEVRDAAQRVAQSSEVTWKSEDAATAAVSLQGVVAGIGHGTTSITATVNGVTGGLRVYVLDPTSSLTPPAIEPELPRDSVDVSWRQPVRTLNVAAGGNLQAALDSARRGDEVVIAAGATFIGNYEVPPKPGTSAQGWITVRTSELASLPPLGERVDRAVHAASMPKIATPNSNYALAVLPKASGWRFVGIEVTATQTAALQPNVNYGLFWIGAGDNQQNSLSEAPTDVILDRVYVHGQSGTNSTRCVALNSAATAIIGSDMAECHAKGYDSQAIAGWNGPGPYLIENNRLEAAGEVVIFGGSDPPIPNLIPSDIIIRRNHLYRPMSWRGQWTIKNLFELKNAQRVLFENNVLENNWVDGQIGHAVLLGSVNQGGRCGWCIVQDVTVRYNHIHNSAGAIHVLERCGLTAPGGSYGCSQGAQPTRRVAIRHNLMTNIGDASLGTNGRMFQIIGRIDDLAIENNTGFAPRIYLVFGDQPSPMARFSFRNNIGGEAEYTMHAAGATGARAVVLNTAAGSRVEKNIIITQTPTNILPPNNTYVRARSVIGFAEAAGLASWRLSSESPYRASGSGNSTPGVNVDELIRRVAGVVPASMAVAAQRAR